MPSAIITGVGMYAPGDPVNNAYFDQFYGKDLNSFLMRERNIFQRHFCAPNQATSDLMLEASRSALTQAGLRPGDLDLIISATDTPDYISPATAHVLQHKLEATRASVFDMNAACASFIIALDAADKFMRQDRRYKNVLITSAYAMSKFFNWDDFKVTSVFADGAGAVILTRDDTDKYGVIDCLHEANGQYHDYMGIYAGGTFLPTTHETVENRQNKLAFVKRIPNDTNPTHWPRMIHSLLDRNGLSVGDIARFFFTQINVQSIRQTLDALGCPQERAHMIMDRYGYTGCACIPMGLADAERSGQLKDGDLIMLVASGGGMSMAVSLIRWKQTQSTTEISHGT